MGVAGNFDSWIARQIGPSLWQRVATEAAPPTAADAETLNRKAIAQAQVLWLVGKTGAGKTSIVRALTGETGAEIGAGWKPCTRTARLYELPAGPFVLRFLDTRGLGEPGYDPTDDIQAAEAQATAMIAVVKSKDMELASIVHVVAEARRRHPHWPVIVVQTMLHAHYPPGRRDHPMPYPFTGGQGDDANPTIPEDLRRALADQRARFSSLPGDPPRFVPIDLTLPEEGFAPPDYGIEALRHAVADAGIEIIELLHKLHLEAENEAIARAARTLVLGYATAAAGGGGAPVPVAGAAVLVSTAALMLRALADRYGVPLTAAHLAALGSAIGAGALAQWGARYGVRELLKLVPGVGTVLAGAMNAAAAFALIYALGEAALSYFGDVRAKRTPVPEEVRQAFLHGLQGAFRMRGEPTP